MPLSKPSTGFSRLPGFLGMTLLIACMAACAHAATLTVAPGAATFMPMYTLDLYRSSFEFTTLALTAFPFTSSGIRHFRFRIIGRDPGSTGYLSFFDHIQFNKQ